MIPLHDGDGPTPAWDILNDVMLRWEEGGPDNLPCPRCGDGAGLAWWRFQPPWAFGNLTLNFWDWSPLGKEFVRRVSDLLGHRVVVITTNI